MHVAPVGDRHADLADLAARELVVGVVAGLRRQVERDRQARLALREVARGRARWTSRRSNGPRRSASSRAGRARAGGGGDGRVAHRLDCMVRSAEGHASPRPIDVRHLGHERVICCWQAGDVLVDPGPESSQPTLLEALGTDDWRPRALLLTHIHFDHAGRDGRARAPLARPRGLRPRARRAAPDRPRRSCSRAPRRLYGDEQMARLWGEVVPVPRRTCASLERRRDAGARRRRAGRVHARPRLAPRLLPARAQRHGRSSATWRACGPAGGRDDRADAAARHRRRGVGRLARRDRRLASRRASALTHFGTVEDVGAQLEAVRARARRAGRRSRRERPAPRRGVEAAVRDRVRHHRRPPARTAYAAAMPPRHISRPGSAGTGEDGSGRPRAGWPTDDRAPAHAGSRHRPGRPLARHRAQRRPQHVRPRGAHARALRPRRDRRRRLRAIADAIHNSGQAIVWSGQQEPAELYWEQLNDAGLTMAPLEQG